MVDLGGRREIKLLMEFIFCIFQELKSGKLWGSHSQGGAPSCLGIEVAYMTSVARSAGD